MTECKAGNTAKGWFVEASISSGHFYFGRVRSKGFATLRNVSKVTLFSGTRLGMQSLLVFSFIQLFDEVRAKLVRDVLRSL